MTMVVLNTEWFCPQLCWLIISITISYRILEISTINPRYTYHVLPLELCSPSDWGFIPPEVGGPWAYVRFVMMVDPDRCSRPGKRVQKTNWNITMLLISINGKTHYFYGNFQ